MSGSKCREQSGTPAMNRWEQSIFDMYLQYHLGKSEACQRCRQASTGLSRPISIWHVGTSYEESPYKVLFVGKAARGSIVEAPFYMDTVEDATVIAADLYYNSGWAFWGYTRAIASAVYGEENAWEQIALTNMVKCNRSDTVDTTIQDAKISCAEYLRREIALLCPRHIVFYTNAGYDEAIQRAFDRIEDSQYQDFPCGKKAMHLWAFTGVIGESRIKAIRTGHPERMKKGDFTSRIIDFILGKQ